MQYSAKWNTTNQILKTKDIKLTDINGLASSQIKKMWDRCRSQENALEGKIGAWVDEFHGSGYGEDAMTMSIQALFYLSSKANCGRKNLT